MRTLCREFKAAGVRLKLSLGALPANIAPDLSLALFRVTQEALNNAAKHSRATRIHVRLASKDGVLLLNISDNGRGVSLGSKSHLSGRGLGLHSMRERAESAGGSFELLSAREAGTYITVRIPLDTPERGRK